MCMYTDICYIDKDKRYVQYDIKQNFGLHRKKGRILNSENRACGMSERVNVTTHNKCGY